MNKNKLMSKYILNGSFHTLEIKSDVPNKENGEVSNEIIKTSVNEKGTEATSKINPNKVDGDIFRFSEFENTFRTILEDVGIDDYRITRADMRFDSYDKNHYLEFAKLNKYIISALAVTYSVKNRYRALELFTDQQISIAIKNDYFQAESYDREHKSKITNNTKEPAKARFEERTLSRQWRKLNDGNLEFCGDDWNMELLKKEFTKGWETRWNKAKENLKLVQQVYNEALLEKYRKGKNARPVQFRTLTDFLIQNQDSIFTSMQMVDLLTRLKEENPELDINPENKARYHKKTYGIEYFSQKDVDLAIKEIMRATKEYFEN